MGVAEVVECKMVKTVRNEEVVELAREIMHQHVTGKCHPCVAFSLREGGCFKGNHCTHCHYCTAEQAMHRRAELQAQARQKTRRHYYERAVPVKRFWL